MLIKDLPLREGSHRAFLEGTAASVFPFLNGSIHYGDLVLFHRCILVYQGVGKLLFEFIHVTLLRDAQL